MADEREELAAWIDKRVEGEWIIDLGGRTDRAQLTRIAAALRSAPTEPQGERVEGWQPIETAPKDGTPVLVHARAGWIGRVSWWSDEDYGDYGDSCFQDEHREPVEIELLTHWMPLPAPPTPGSGA